MCLALRKSRQNSPLYPVWFNTPHGYFLPSRFLRGGCYTSRGVRTVERFTSGNSWVLHGGLSCRLKLGRLRSPGSSTLNRRSFSPHYLGHFVAFRLSVADSLVCPKTTLVRPLMRFNRLSHYSHPIVSQGVRNDPTRFPPLFSYSACLSNLSYRSCLARLVPLAPHPPNWGMEPVPLESVLYIGNFWREVNIAISRREVVSRWTVVTLLKE